jgi:hypothetical protein
MTNTCDIKLSVPGITAHFVDPFRTVMYRRHYGDNNYSTRTRNITSLTEWPGLWAYTSLGPVGERHVLIIS